MTYAEKLKDPRWQKKRLEIFNRDDWCCRLCKKDNATLNVRHFEYMEDPWTVPDESLITLCNGCHELIGEIEGVFFIKPGMTKKLCKDGFFILTIDGSPFDKNKNINYNKIKRLINCDEEG